MAEIGRQVAVGVQCEFFLFRYVPDVVTEEFVNIGVLIREREGSASPLLRFTRDWSRVQSIHPDADIALLQAIETEISDRLKRGSVDIVIKELTESLSNSLQIVGPRACLAAELVTELDQLMRLFVDRRT